MAALDEAIAEMKQGTVEGLRDHVEREFRKRIRVRRGLDDGDVKEFWDRARGAAELFVT